MLSERVDTDTLHIDEMHVVCPRAGGLDVHKMCITAAVRLCEAGRGLARTAVREFSALPDGLRAMTDWLRSHGVTAAAMEGTGVYWKAPFEALEDAGIHADLLNAQHVKQIRGKKTDASDSLWLARICQFGLALPSYVPPRRFRQLRQLTRYRRTLVAERSRTRNRVHKIRCRSGTTRSFCCWRCTDYAPAKCGICASTTSTGRTIGSVSSGPKADAGKRSPSRPVSAMPSPATCVMSDPRRQAGSCS